MTLHMLSIPTNPGRLYEWARREAGLSLDDEGYLLHVALRKAFGGASPQPFALKKNRAGDWTVLGYGPDGADDLRREQSMIASPLLTEAFQPRGVASKAMPEDWPAGRRFGFEVCCCPIKRGKAGQGPAEHDVYLRERLHEAETSPDQVYRDWLAEELARYEAADLLGCEAPVVRSFRPVRRGPRGPRRLRSDRKAVAFSGTLRIRDPAGFEALLARGLGRHRAFGFGMLLLRAVGR
ncbi:MAG: system Cascade subunit CasE [Desulfovibrionales bacterium]|jgi:CRISPR system Cascade subunit CasE|nr:system Cascade subunit CasE [Desulfovibrionales bacterium]